MFTLHHVPGVRYQVSGVTLLFFCFVYKVVGQWRVCYQQGATLSSLFYDLSIFFLDICINNCLACTANRLCNQLIKKLIRVIYWKHVWNAVQSYFNTELGPADLIQLKQLKDKKIPKQIKMRRHSKKQLLVLKTIKKKTLQNSKMLPWVHLISLQGVIF